jgi:hypothetical protein
MYHITAYTRRRARDLGVQVRPSKLPNKKIDVLQNGIKITSCGHPDYSDYPTYIKTKGKKYANTRRRLYWIRHKKDAKTPGTAGYYAARLLW